MRYVLTVAKSLLVSDKIGSIARSLGYDVIARLDDEAIAKARLSSPVLIVVDLESSLDFLGKLKSSGITSVVAGFYPQNKPELKQAAEKFGYTNIFPYSALENRLNDLL